MLPSEIQSYLGKFASANNASGQEEEQCDSPPQPEVTRPPIPTCFNRALRNDQEANNFLAEVMELAAQLEGECENVH